MATADLSKLKISRDNNLTLGKPRRRYGWWVTGLIAALLIGYGLMRMSQAPITVSTGVVANMYPSQVITVLNATGRVSAQRKAAVSTKATGRLTYLGVQEGSVVKSGQVIARIENLDVTATEDQAQASLRAAKANLEQGLAELRDAEANYKRSVDLAAKNFISSATLDTATARQDKAKAVVASLNGAIGVAEANVRATKVSVEQTLIRAPFDGVILTKNANVGDIITPFSSAANSKGAVVDMADMSTLEVEADVSETSIAKTFVGQPVEIQLDAFPELRLLGTVSRTVPTVDRSKATLLVKIAFVERDTRVLPDMSAKVAFLSRELSPAERKPVIAVLPNAITQRDGRDVVFLIENGIAKQTAITAAAKLGDMVPVSGIAAGGKVVLDPPKNLKNGARIDEKKQA